MRALAVLLTVVALQLPLTAAAADDAASPAPSTPALEQPAPAPSETPSSIPPALRPGASPSATPVPTPAPSAKGNGPTTKQVERAFTRLGIPTGVVDNTWTQDTRRATCIWRELTGRTPKRTLAGTPERHAIITTKTLTVPASMKPGLHVNIACQSAIWVQATTAGTRAIERIMPVTTGIPGAHDTRPGTFTIFRATNRWHESTLYEDAMMYRPMYFSGGQALHGSASDRMVGTRPASHGCVRMLHADIDRLWKAGFGVGDMVRVYGTWRG